MRKIEQISISVADRERLERLVRDRNAPQEVVWRPHRAVGQRWRKTRGADVESDLAECQSRSHSARTASTSPPFFSSRATQRVPRCLTATGLSLGFKRHGLLAPISCEAAGSHC